MSLKRQHEMLAGFSMASMTDVIFLLLVFFLVTSSFVFPTAVEVNLPQGVEQTAIKPGTRVYIDPAEQIYVAYGEAEPAAVSSEALVPYLAEIHSQDSTATMALYADSAVHYGRVMQVLNASSEAGLKMVLATKAAPKAVKPALP